jgi:hypothetical protein
VGEAGATTDMFKKFRSHPEFLRLMDESVRDGKHSNREPLNP